MRRSRWSQPLEDRFPKARLVGGDADFEMLVAQVVGLIEAPGQPSTLPLDLARHGVPAASVAGAEPPSRRASP